MKECNACPLKSIGYHYFDYARYYRRTHNCNEAMGMASSLNLMRNIVANQVMGNVLRCP